MLCEIPRRGLAQAAIRLTQLPFCTSLRHASNLLRARRWRQASYNNARQSAAVRALLPAEGFVRAVCGLVQDFPKHDRLRRAANEQATIAASFRTSTMPVQPGSPSCARLRIWLLYKATVRGSMPLMPHRRRFLLPRKAVVLDRASAALLSFVPVGSVHGLHMPVPWPVRPAFHVE